MSSRAGVTRGERGFAILTLTYLAISQPLMIRNLIGWTEAAKTSYSTTGIGQCPLHRNHISSSPYLSHTQIGNGALEPAGLKRQTYLLKIETVTGFIRGRNLPHDSGPNNRSAVVLSVDFLLIIEIRTENVGNLLLLANLGTEVACSRVLVSLLVSLPATRDQRVSSTATREKETRKKSKYR